MLNNFNKKSKMEGRNGVHHFTNGNSGKNGSLPYKIPIYEIPRTEDIFICFNFNEQIKSIESHFISKTTDIWKNYSIF